MERTSIFQFRAPVLRVFSVLAMVLAFQVPVPAASEEPGFHIDLSGSPVWYRVGFDPGDLERVPQDTDLYWRRLERFSASSSLTIRELGIPGLPKRSLLPPGALPEIEFTFLIPFHAAPEQAAALRGENAPPPGLFIEGLGDNWEIYLNGRLVRREMYLDESGGIRVHRALSNLSFPLAPEDIREGGNVLAVRALGTVSGQFSGFFRTSSFYAGNFAEMLRRERIALTVNAALAAVMLLSAVSFFWLYFSRKKERWHFFLGGSVLAFALYFLADAGLPLPLVPDTVILFRVKWAGLFLVLPLFALHGELRRASPHLPGIGKPPAGKTSLPMKIYALLCLLFASALFVFPHGFEPEILNLWRISLVPGAAFFLVHDLLGGYLAGARARHREALRGQEKSTRIELYLAELGESFAGKALLAVGALLIAAAVDGVNVLFFRGGAVFFRAGLVMFAAGSALAPLLRSIALLDSLDRKDRELAESGESLRSLRAALDEADGQLSQKARELVSAHTRMALNERQYQDLFEQYRDPLAVLDGNLRFRRANGAAIRLFGLSGEDMENRSPGVPGLADRLYQGAPDREILVEQFWNAVYALKLNKMPVELEVFIQGETRIDCSLRLEYRLSLDTGFEIFAWGRVRE